MLGASVPVGIPRAVFAGAAERGVDPEVLAKAAGFDLALLDDVDARAPAPLVVRLWDEAARLTKDDTFGLRLGWTSPTTAMPLVGRLIVASTTLGEGLARVVAYYRVFNDVHPLALAHEGDDVVVRVLASGAPLKVPRQGIEFAFAWFLAVAGHATKARATFTSVSFEHPAPDDVSAHESILGCKPTFDAGETSFRASRTLFERRHAAPDPLLVELLESHASALLATLPPRAPTSARVKAILGELLPRGDANIELAAEALRLSPRTLQRKLKDEGTSFTDLVDELRCSLAKQHLRAQLLSIAEIALLVGFSDQSTFHRAFVRWTGATPGDFRRRG